MIMDEWLRIKCPNCNVSMALPKTEQTFVIHCPLCSGEVEINPLPAEGGGGCCRYCGQFLDAHRWSQEQGSYERVCPDRRKL